MTRLHHRFERLSVTAFVSPATGESDWSLVNRHFETLADLVAERCVALAGNQDPIQGQAGFHRWPGCNAN